MEEPQSMRHIERISNILSICQPSLGEGTYARVYKAIDEETKQLVAVKQVDVPPIEVDAVKQVMNLQKIKSDHSIKYFKSYYDDSDKTLNVVMELCNCSLRKIIGSKQFSRDQILHFFAQMVAAMLELSRKGLMHLDLKPENILICLSNSTFYKICDFGCSQNARQSFLSQYSSDCFGTFNYLGPENVFAYKGKIKKSSADVWSLGVVLYEMIYKILPFKTEKGRIMTKELEDFFQNRLKIDYPYGNSVPTDVLKLIQLMLVADPNSRATWKELKKILIDEYRVSECYFYNLQDLLKRHLMLLNAFLIIIVIVGRNVEYNPHQFWTKSKCLLEQFAADLTHFSYLFSARFQEFYSFKEGLLTSQMKKNLYFLSQNIKKEERSLPYNLMGEVISNSLYKKCLGSVLLKALKIKNQLNGLAGPRWEAMQTLFVFCCEMLECFQGNVKVYDLQREVFPETMQILHIQIRM